ncbi:MAG: hypothetical protein HOC71_10360, partial [Candidatus Latescibacteria bacterium]|nr:hypothetical protein [Candidatus Latescibacterota bacterium]
KSQESTVSKEFLKQVKASIDSFKTICDSQSPEKIWVGLPSIEDASLKKHQRCLQKKPHNELVNICNLPEHCDDTTLFTVLLSPGEFTAPKLIEDTGLVQIKNLPIKDEKFAEVRDSLVASMSQLHFLYFRPFEWTPAFRIETGPIIAGDSSRYKALLNCIKYQCRTAGISEPYPVFRAGEMVKSFARAIPVLRKSVLSHITSLYKDNLGEILPLLIDRTNT